MVKQKEQLKLRKEIKKVKALFSRDGIITNVRYTVYGIYLKKYSDRSEDLTYLIKCDDGVLRDIPISNFEIIEEVSADSSHD